jgi:anti-sigma factor RsiW
MHMNQSHYPISDELLSAYIDGDVTEEEKRQIELAIATDAATAWQVETLRQTVELLQDLPVAPLPRSFVLQEDQVSDVLMARRNSRAVSAQTVAGRPTFTQRFWVFWSSGNLALRNASAIVALLFVVLLVGEPYLPTPTATPASQISMMESAPAGPAPAAAPAADLEEPEEPAMGARMMEEAVPQQIPDEPQAATAPEDPEPLPEADESAATLMRVQPTQDPTAVEESAAARSAETFAEESAPAEEAAPMRMESMSLPEDSGDSDVGLEEDAEEGVVILATATLSRSLDQEADVAESPSTYTADEAADEPAGDKSTEMKVESLDQPSETDEETLTLPSVLEEQDPEGVEFEESTLLDEPVAEPAVVTEDEPFVAEDAVESTAWGMWRTMQVGTLLLSMVLVLLWLGSHRRAAGR